MIAGAFGGHGVEVRGLDELLAVGAEIALGDVIGEDEDEVGFAGEGDGGEQEDDEEKSGEWVWACGEVIHGGGWVVVRGDARQECRACGVWRLQAATPWRVGCAQSRLGKFSGTGMVTSPVAAHSVPLWKVVMKLPWRMCSTP